MRPIASGPAILAAAMLVSACGGSAATSIPTEPAATSAPVSGATATAAPVTAAPATAGPATATAATCHVPDPSEPTTVETSVAGFEWNPVTARVGDVITWSNGDGAPHGVKTDDGTCRMPTNIGGGGTGSLVFDVAGVYPFTCTVHANMKSTITITE